MSEKPERWLVIDDIIKRLGSFWLDEGVSREATFVTSVEGAHEALAGQEFDVLSLDYSLSWSSGGTTQPLVDWLVKRKRVRKFAHRVRINMHSGDYRSANRIGEQLAAAGYDVAYQRIT